jgi:ribonucleoside-diphosphate reductase alpha chain
VTLSVAKLSQFADKIYRQKYAHPGENWPDTANRVATHVMGALGYGPRHEVTREIERLIVERKFIPGGRYLYASGRPLHQTQNCLLLRAEDSREGWGELWQKVGMALMTGAGIGVDYSDVRPEGAPISRTGGLASGPLGLAQSVNEIGRQVMQGGSRRSAIWMGLSWKHDDVYKFIRIKDWTPEQRALKERDISFPLPMEFTNVSVQLDDEFFAAYADESHPLHRRARTVYRLTLQRMLKTAEPGFSVDTGAASGETLRNACTEVTSADDSDICNLGSLNLGRISSREEMRHAVDLASLFLLAGTVYSDVPYERVADVRELNRRLGLGLMGVHEWLLQRGKSYGPDAELDGWLQEYSCATEVAGRWADAHNLSRPVKTRAVAPTGTIAIIGETTTGVEPVFCVAYLRRWLKGGRWAEEAVVDPTADRLVKQGIPPDAIEDAYTLAHDVERRVAFQAWLQRHVDHGISSTINLPAPVTDPDECEDFGNMLMRHLPNLRGVTCYPDGARWGQPITAIPYAEVAKRALVEESEERCTGGACGI